MDNINDANDLDHLADLVLAKILSKYMIDRMVNKERAKGKNSDNMLLNEFIINNRSNFLELGGEWNYMPFLPNSKIIKKPNFFHFVGILGKEIINTLQKKKINIENFLSEIRKK